MWTDVLMFSVYVSVSWVLIVLDLFSTDVRGFVNILSVLSSRRTIWPSTASFGWNGKTFVMLWATWMGNRGKTMGNCGNVSGDGCANLGHAASHTARGQQGNVDVCRKSMPTKRADFPPQPQDDWADDCDADMMWPWSETPVFHRGLRS